MDFINKFLIQIKTMTYMHPFSNMTFRNYSLVLRHLIQQNIHFKHPELYLKIALTVISKSKDQVCSLIDFEGRGLNINQWCQYTDREMHKD